MQGQWDAGRTMSGAVPLAIEYVNEQKLTENFEIAFVWRDSQCNPGKALAAMSELMELKVDAFIGPGCSVATEPTQLLASNRGFAQARPSASKNPNSKLRSAYKTFVLAL